ncbi:hypothetical protein MAR_004322 [Mya arenaria]|uniref:Uncharacterized protein n=1 Tax=Mya arenaria TaxID=6604 RepID=A0ABY7EZC0_MYAAR|nr:hypothetical protein MAR_004322 [Mya arenaria]
MPRTEDVKDTALLKQKKNDFIVQKNLKSTNYVTTETFGTEISTLEQTLNEASRNFIGPLYEFQKNDVVRNLILTENVYGTLEEVHTGNDELTQTITREQKHLQIVVPIQEDTKHSKQAYTAELQDVLLTRCQREFEKDNSSNPDLVNKRAEIAKCEDVS